MNHQPPPDLHPDLRLVATGFAMALCLWTPPLHALEEDANQPVEIEADKYDYTLDGTMKVFGSPVRITQGTLLITGLEVHIEQEGDVIRKVTAFGEPARFQQQLNENQEPIHAAGLTLSFDNAAQRISIVDQAEVILPNGTRSTGYQFEYDLAERSISSVDGPDGQPVRIVIPPGTGQ